jgi:hypothetical protein
MDPQLMNAPLWDDLSRAMIGLFLFVGLAINAGLAFLCGHAIIPSLVGTGDVPPATRAFRWVFYPLFAVSAILTVYALMNALMRGVGVLQQFFPRFVI